MSRGDSVNGFLWFLDNTFAYIMTFVTLHEHLNLMDPQHVRVQ